MCIRDSAGVVGRHGDRVSEAERRADLVERFRPHLGVQQVGHTADPGDPGVAERDQIAHGLGDRAAVVGPDLGDRAGLAGAADDHGRQLELLEHRDADVVLPQVGDDHAVDAALAPPAAVDLDLLLGGGHHLEGQRVGLGTELGFETADQAHEPRLDAEDPGGAAEGEADGAGAGAGEGAGGAVRVEADLLRDGEDPLAGGLGDAGLTVQRIGHGAFGHTGTPGDVGDRGPFHAVPSVATLPESLSGVGPA